MNLNALSARSALGAVFCLLVSTLLGAANASTVAIAGPLTARMAIEQAQDGSGEVLPQSVAELDRIRQQLRTTLAAADPAPSVADWLALGFELRPLSPGQPIWLLRERPQGRHGRGVYMWRLGPARPLLVEAPHGTAGDDRMTETIALDLFERLSAKAGAWSTVAREKVDLAHADDTVFQVFTLVFAELFAPQAVLQVHGFARNKRKTEVGRASDVILSNGTREPTASMRSTTACLHTELGARAMVYPDVPELGATTNAQRRALASLAGSHHFRHLELSFELRERFVSEETARASLARCLEELL